MKKLFMFMAVMAATVVGASAQSFAKGDNVIAATVGFGGGYGLPVALSYEVGIVDINEKMAIGVGATVGYGSDKESVDYGNGYSGKWKNTNVLVGATGNYHYTGVDKFDFYGGIFLGYDVASCKWEGDFDAPVSASASAFLVGLNVGARYYFADSWAATAVAGFGISNLAVGVAYKF